MGISGSRGDLEASRQDLGHWCFNLLQRKSFCLMLCKNEIIVFLFVSQNIPRCGKGQKVQPGTACCQTQAHFHLGVLILSHLLCAAPLPYPGKGYNSDAITWLFEASNFNYYDINKSFLIPLSINSCIQNWPIYLLRLIQLIVAFHSGTQLRDRHTI